MDDPAHDRDAHLTPGLLILPAPALVLVLGVPGCGKSTFAARHFRPTEIVSTDACRAMVADDPNDQGASGDAFAVAHLVVERRLKRRRLVTAVDATNLRRRDRRPFLRQAQRTGTPVVAIVLDLPLSLCVARDAARGDRTVGADTLRRMHERLQSSLEHIDDEGCHAVHVLRSAAEVAATSVQRVPFRPAVPLLQVHADQRVPGPSSVSS